MFVFGLFSSSSNDTSRQASSENPPQPTVISAGAFIEGIFHLGDVDLRIEGEVQGDIATEGRVVVGEDAEVEGTINASTVRLAGHVEGKVHAEEKIVLAPTANVYAILDAEVLEIQPDADFRGSVVEDGSNAELNGDPFSELDSMELIRLPRSSPSQNGDV